VITFDNSRSPRPLCDPGGEAPPVACSGGNIYGGKAPARTFYLGMNGYLAGQPVMPLPPTDPRYTEGGEASRVPEVIGKNADDARKILSKAGWKTSLKEVDNRAPEGKVVGQSPRGTALPGEVVTLQVSTGEVPPPPPPPGGADDRDSGYNGVGPDTFGQGGGTAPSAGPALPNQSGRGPGG